MTTEMTKFELFVFVCYYARSLHCKLLLWEDSMDNLDKNRKKNVIKTRTIVLTSALVALEILMGIPGLHLGYIQLPFMASVTIMHIPVIIAAIFIGPFGGILTGFVFGLSSLINAAANPSGVLDPLFVNPLCSILPRILFGLITAYIFKVMDFIPYLPKFLKGALTAFFGTLIHTCLVIGSLYLFVNEQISGIMNVGYFAALAAIIPGAMVEVLVAVVVCTAVLIPQTMSYYRESKLLSSDDSNDSEE